MVLQLKTHVGIVDEGTTLTVGRQLSCGGIFEAFNDGGFARAVVADNQGQRGVEGDGLLVERPEGAHPQNGELLNPRHGVMCSG